MSRPTSRRGQTAVEALLYTSVIVVALVAVGWYLAGENRGGIVDGIRNLADGAATVYANPDEGPPVPGP